MTDVNIGRVNSNGDVSKHFYRQEYVYKNSKEFMIKSDNPCYVSEGRDAKYTYSDFISLSSGNEDIANLVFNSLDWQSPEGVVQEWHGNNELFICKSCNLPNEGDGSQIQFCKYCGFKNDLS